MKGISSISEFIDNLEMVNIESKRMPPEQVELKEVIELFVNTIVPSIQSESEVPKFNIIFSDEAVNLFKKVSEEPFIKQNSYTPDITSKDINRILPENQQDSTCPTVKVVNHEMFFKLLTEIVNEQINLNYKYGENSSARAVAIRFMRRIWLRMGPDDFENVELFLQKQLDFLKNTEFDKPYKEIEFGTYNGRKITYTVEKCETWCETSRRMHFKIYDDNKYHDLPNIYYELREEENQKTCYIYAVQNCHYRHRITSVERSLYKLNKGPEKSKVHPNFLMAMILFFKLLEENNITYIKVPLLQVLSYRYHVLLSDKTKQEFKKNWNKENLDYMELLKNSELKHEKERYYRLKRMFENDLEWYTHVVEKADFISKAKTEGLANLFFQMEKMLIKQEINIVQYDKNSLYISILSRTKNKNRSYCKIKNNINK